VPRFGRIRLDANNPCNRNISLSAAAPPGLPVDNPIAERALGLLEVSVRKVVSTRYIIIVA